MPTTRYRSISLLSLLLALGALPLAAQFAQTSYSLTAANCDAEVKVCSGYSSHQFEFLTFTLDGAAYAKTYDGCDRQTFRAYSLTDMPDEGYSGPYQLVSWVIDGVSHNGTFSEPRDLVDIMRDADPDGGWRLDLGTKSIVGGSPARTYSALDIIQQPTNIAAAVPLVEFKDEGKASFDFAVGSHVLEVRDGATVLERITVEVACTPAAGGYRAVTLDIPGSEVLCFDLSALRGPVVASGITITPAARHSKIELTDNDCFRVSALSVGQDSVSVRYCDAGNNCATQLLAVVAKLATPITPVVIRDSVSVPGQVRTVCLDTTQLPGKIISVVDLCAEPERQLVDFTYIASSRCVKYRGIKPGGTDSTCLVLCDDLGFCDTTKVIVTTFAPTPLPNQTLVFTIDKGTSDRVSLDVEGFATRPAQLSNVCEEASGQLVFFTLDAQELSVAFDGLEVGTERACVLAAASDGVTQRFDVTVNVITRTPARDTIRIKRGDSQRWCFAEPELIGPAVRIYDACPSTTPLVTTATTDVLTCLDFTANTVGSQDLCINVCDATGRCDITNLVILVTQDASPDAPVAVDDAAVVPASGTVVVDVLANDVSASAITSVTVVTGPRGGVASFDASRQLVYVRTAGVPCANDSLVYQICNAAGCARATVRLDLRCEAGPGPGPGPNPGPRGPIEIARVISPNSDGINDTWVIQNIDQYPDNEVKIYNRWGSRVYATRGYDNTWTGDFQDGGPLPDGTYFYVVEIEGGSAISNFLELRR